MLNAGLESVSVQPVYPVKGQGPEAGAALVALEEKVFGRCTVVSFSFHDEICWKNSERRKIASVATDDCFVASSPISHGLQYAECMSRVHANGACHASTVTRCSIRIESRSYLKKPSQSVATMSFGLSWRSNMSIDKTPMGQWPACGE